MMWEGPRSQWHGGLRYGWPPYLVVQNASHSCVHVCGCVRICARARVRVHVSVCACGVADCE